MAKHEKEAKSKIQVRHACSSCGLCIALHMLAIVSEILLSHSRVPSRIAMLARRGFGP